MNIISENITVSSKKRTKTNEKNKLNEIKEKIETDAEKQVIQINKSINSFQDYVKPEIGNLLINIMKTGADEFKEKTGRNMTYSEMREMFG
jgi:hypothetical protein